MQTQVKYFFQRAVVYRAEAALGAEFSASEQQGGRMHVRITCRSDEALQLQLLARARMLEQLGQCFRDS